MSTKTLNLPIDLLCRKFSIDDVSKEHFAAVLERVSGGIDAGKIELDVAGKNQLQIFCDEADLYEWLAGDGYVGRALLGYLYGCDGNMLHGPDCDCTLLAPSKRQGQVTGVKA